MNTIVKTSQFANYFQRTIHLILYTILSYLVYTYLLRPVFNALFHIYHYRRFHCLPRNFFLGNLLRIAPRFPIPSSPREISLNTDSTFCELADSSKYRDISVLWFGPFPLVVVSNYEAVEVVMDKSSVSKPFFYRFVPLKNGLATSEAGLWKIRRKAIEPFFVTKKQRRFVKIMDEEIKSLPKLLAQWIGKPVDIEHSIHSSSLNVICKVAASVPLKDLTENKDILLDAMNQLEQITMCRIFNPLYWFDSVIKFTKIDEMYSQTFTILDNVVTKVLDRRKEEMKLSPPEVEDNDFIQILEPHTDEKGLAEELITTITAGHETVSVGTRWVLFVLGNHPDIQERVYREIMDYFPGDEPVNDLDKINQCTYLDQCLKESLRLFPPIHTIARVLTQDVMVKGKKLLKGTSTFICIKSVHRDPSVYPNPTKYDPERWSPENVKQIPKAAFIPFAYGPRNCIGYRYAMIIMKVYLVHVLRQFRLKSTRKEETVRTRLEISNKPDSPLEIILTPREKNSQYIE